MSSFSLFIDSSSLSAFGSVVSTSTLASRPPDITMLLNSALMSADQKKPPAWAAAEKWSWMRSHSPLM